MVKEKFLVREDFQDLGGHRYVSSQCLSELSPKVYRKSATQSDQVDLGVVRGIEKRFSLRSLLRTGSAYEYTLRTSTEGVELGRGYNSIPEGKFLVVQLPRDYHFDLPVSGKYFDAPAS